MTRLPILYSFRRCPYAMRARIALVSSGQHCELREVVLKDKPQELLAASPKGTVPVLLDTDGTVIDQSLDIMLWALQRHDPAHWLHPSTGHTVADMLALVTMCDTDFKHHLDRYKYPQRHGVQDHAAHQSQAAAFVQQLEARLPTEPYLFGDHACLADMAVAPFVRQFAQVEPTWFTAQPWPRVHRWLADLLGHVAYTQAMGKYPQWQPGTQGCHFPPGPEPISS